MCTYTRTHLLLSSSPSHRSTQLIAEVPLNEMSSERYVDIRGYQQSNLRESGENSFVGSIVDVEQVCPLFLSSH